MYPYSRSHNPPAPYAPVTISPITDPSNIRTRDALIDTGAGITGIPISLITELDLQPIRHQPLRSATEIQERPIYVVNLTFHGQRFENIPVVKFTQGNFILLGRDIINTMQLCFDGKSMITNVVMETR